MWKWKNMRRALGPMLAPKDPDDGEGGGGDGAAAFTPAQIKEMTKVVNSAVTGQLGRKLKEAVSGELTTALSPIMERLEALAPKPDGDGDGDNAGGGSKGGKGAQLSPEMKKRFDELERTNKKLVEDNKRAADETAAQKRANEQAEERTQLQAALKRAGVSDDRIGGAAALLYHDQKKLKRNAAGDIVMTQKDSYGNVEEVDLDTGLGEWVKSSEGKAYLPPIPVQGGGSRGGTPGNNRGKAEPTESELLGELGNVLMGGKPTINLG